MSDIKNKKWIKNYVLLVLDEIKDIPQEEREKVDFRIKMTLKHKTFSDKFPSLLMILLDQSSEFDMQKLDEMLSILDSVQTGQRNVDEVDRELGQEYFDKYVAPHINN